MNDLKFNWKHCHQQINEGINLAAIKNGLKKNEKLIPNEC